MCKKIEFLLCVLVFVLVFSDSAAYSQISLSKVPANLDFESVNAENNIISWQLNPASVTNGYQFLATEENPFAGKTTGLLKRDGVQPSRVPGILMQMFDAANYRGKRVRFRAAVLSESNGTGQAQLWMRVDKKPVAGAPSTGFFDNMDDRPITSPKWQSYEIIGDIAPDAESVTIGLLMIGAGSTRIDDASFEIIGDADPIIIEKSRALSTRGLANVTAFARLIGYVRYFHPSDQAYRTNWESFTIRGMREIESATDSKQLALKLSQMFKPIAPTIEIYAGKRNVSISIMPKEATKAVMWQHNGIGISPKSSYSSTRNDIKLVNGKLPPEVPAPLVTMLSGGVSAIIPFYVYADNTGTLPHAKSVQDNKTVQAVGMQPTRVIYTGDDRATRLADIALAWNIFEHFYPYYEESGIDWMSVLKPAMSAAATDTDERQFENTLKFMVSRLNDGHGAVNRASSAIYAPPVTWDWIDNKLVITSLTVPNERIKPGDAVISINGVPVEKLLREKEALISAATPQWKLYRALQELAQSEKDTKIILEIESLERSPDQPMKVSLVCNTPYYTLVEKRPAKITELENDIYYINLDQITSSDFKAILPKLEQARGIIFDLRGYPRLDDPLTFFSHLSEQPLLSAKFLVPIIIEPDHHNMQFQGGGEWQIKPAAPFLKAKKVFITDGRAISYAESVMGIVENYKLGEIVGSPTAGTNGNINSFVLPGGYQVIWTGMKVRKHDGSPHHGVGILPTVPVKRTRNGIAAGKDELLDKAMEVLRKQLLQSKIKEPTNTMSE